MHTEAQGHSRVNIVTGVCIKLVTLFSKSFDKNSSKNRASVPLCEKKLHTEAQGHSRVSKVIDIFIKLVTLFNSGFD